MYNFTLNTTLVSNISAHFQNLWPITNLNLTAKHKRPRNLKYSLVCRQLTIAASLIIMETHRGVHKLLLHAPGPKLKRPPDPDLHAPGGVTRLDLPNNNLIRWHQEKSAGRDRGGAAGCRAWYKHLHTEFNHISASAPSHDHWEILTML